MSEGDCILKVGNKPIETTQSAQGENDEESDQSSFEIDELELSDREAEDIDVNHRRIKCISKLETIPNVSS